MRGAEQQLSERGAELVYVGPVDPGSAAAFRQEHGLAAPVLSDPAGEAFGAAEMRRGIRPMLSLRAVTNGLRALRAGFRQRKVEGNPWQQGGVLVFAANGALLAQQRDVGVGDLLDVDAALRPLG